MKLLSDWGFSPDSWQGQRGEYWLFVQIILMLGFVAMPVYHPVNWKIAPPMLHWAEGTAIVLGLLGIFLLTKGVIDLGQNLTPLPHPREDGELVESGVYGIVRHPVYSGVILGAIAWTLYQISLSHLIGAIVLFAFLNAKASREENWLIQKHPSYADYRKQVKKLIPWLY